MKIIHKLHKQQREGDGLGLFLLTNSSGDFFSTSQNIFSKYNGLINYDEHYQDYFKSLESIRIEAGNPLRIINYYDRIEIIYEGEVKEIYRITEQGLIYSVQNYQGKIHLLLDIKQLYDESTEGRIYKHKIQKDKARLITNYKKYSENKLAYEASLVILGARDAVVKNHWLEMNYPYEQRRNDSSNYWVNNSYEINCNGSAHLVFSFGKTELSAIKKANEVARRINVILREKQEELSDYNSTIEEDTALFALKQLLVKRKNDNRKKLLAGYPWFHQNWSRDELVSLGAMIKKGFYQESKEAIVEAFDHYHKQGFKAMTSGEGLNSKDSLAWLAKRTQELLIILKKEKKLHNYFSPHELGYLREKTRYIIKKELEESRNELIFNDDKETWMDTISRKGFCLEIQFGFLALLDLENYLSRFSKVKTKYYKEFFRMKKIIKSRFFNKNNYLLADNINEGHTDYTFRPNIFLAHYLYPELLSNKEWDKVFEKSLEKLNMKNGLLSSVDQKHSLFKGVHAGSNNQSYHNGDSWFFINNLAAITLYKVNKKKYKYLIEQIKETSINNLFFEGCIANCNEISSSSKLEPLGCFAQTWSNATLLELLLLTKV